MRIGRPSGLTLRGPICSSSAANVFSSDARTRISWLIFSVKFSMAGSTATILPPLKCMRRTLVALGAFLDSIELIAPVAFEESGPFMERPERRGVGSIQDLPPVAAGADDADVPQHSQVLRHGGLRQLHRVHDFVDRSLIAGNELENRTALRFGNRIEDVGARGGPGHIDIIFLYGNMSSISEPYAQAEALSPTSRPPSSH